MSTWRVAVVGPFMDQAGATLVSRYQVAETLPGHDLPQFVSIIGYPSAAAIRMVFDEAFSPARP